MQILQSILDVRFELSPAALEQLRCENLKRDLQAAVRPDQLQQAFDGTLNALGPRPITGLLRVCTKYHVTYDMFREKYLGTFINNADARTT